MAMAEVTVTAQVADIATAEVTATDQEGAETDGTAAEAVRARVTATAEEKDDE